MAMMPIQELNLNLLRKLLNQVTGHDSGQGGLNAPQTKRLREILDSGIAPSVLVQDKKFPLHAISDDPQGLGGNTGGVIVVGDATNPDDSYTRTLVNSAYSASPGAGTDTSVRTTTASKNFYLYGISYTKITSELVTIKDGSAGPVRFYLKPAANSPAYQQFQAPLLFTTGVFTNQATSESTQILLIGWEQ